MVSLPPIDAIEKVLPASVDRQIMPWAVPTRMMFVLSGRMPIVHARYVPGNVASESHVVPVSVDRHRPSGGVPRTA